jgi:hypothetical protein
MKLMIEDSELPDKALAWSLNPKGHFTQRAVNSHIAFNGEPSSWLSALCDQLRNEYDLKSKFSLGTKIERVN